MTTYPGMTLRGEVRESISLDEDDLSDVEDEVFIRDGKRGYKVHFYNGYTPTTGKKLIIFISLQKNWVSNVL